MINFIRQILIKIDPTVAALKPKVSENLFEPLEAKVGLVAEEISQPIDCGSTCTDKENHEGR